MTAVAALVARHLRDPASSFSIGTLGALAEFHRAPNEPVTLALDGRLAAVTDRGAIRIDLRPGVLPLAYETLSARLGLWQHGVIFGLPEREAAGPGRQTLTELGPDVDAARPRDRQAILFDLGMDLANGEFCIRSADPALLAILRAQAGRRLLAPDNPAMAAILAASPHRVARSALGRIEVYQAIPLDETPEGPHTHVLPRLLAGRRTHSANIPLPDGVLPSLGLHPAHPALTAQGTPRPFDAALHEAFQDLVGLWGDPVYRAEKARLRKALDQGIAADPLPTRLGRLAARILERQRAAAA